MNQSPPGLRSDHGEPEGSQSKTDPPKSSAKLDGMPPRRDARTNYVHCSIHWALLFNAPRRPLTVIAGQHGRPSHLEAAVYQVEVPLRLTIGSSFNNASAGWTTCFPTGQNFVVSSRHCWLSVARMTMTTTERDDEELQS